MVKVRRKSGRGLCQDSSPALFWKDRETCDAVSYSRQDRNHNLRNISVNAKRSYSLDLKYLFCETQCTKCTYLGSVTSALSGKYDTDGRI